MCGDPGYGVFIAWAQPVYVEVECAEGEPGFEPERWGGWDIPCSRLVVDEEATLARVALALECDGPVKRTRIEPSLEFLLSSSVRVIVDDFGSPILQPVV